MAPCWNPPRFDAHQFAGRRAKAVNAHYTPEGWDTTGISFNDFQSMHTHRRQVQRERRLETPEWVHNTKMLREAILRFCERRLYIRTWKKLNEPSTLSDADRLARIREKELNFAKTRLEPVLRRLIERERTNKSPKLAIQIQGYDSLIRMCRQGTAGVIARVVHLYYKCGYDSVEVAQETGLHPPWVRQSLARMDQAARGYTYICPKHQRHREWRAELNGIKNLFLAVKKHDTQQDEKELDASRSELQALMNKVTAAVNNRKPAKKQWTRGRFLFCYLLRLDGKTWHEIAPKIGYSGAHNVRAYFYHFMRHPDLLAD
jgi:hypothetical protein